MGYPFNVAREDYSNGEFTHDFCVENFSPKTAKKYPKNMASSLTYGQKKTIDSKSKLSHPQKQLI